MILMFFIALKVCSICRFSWREVVALLCWLEICFFFQDFSIILLCLCFAFFCNLMNLNMSSCVISKSISVSYSASSFITVFLGSSNDLIYLTHFAQLTLSTMLVRTQVKGLISHSFCLLTWNIWFEQVLLSIFLLIFSRNQSFQQ